MPLDAYLKIEGPDVEGESLKEGHEGELELLSYNWGLSNSGTTHSGTGSGAGQAHFQDLTVLMNIDKSSSLIFKQAASGKHFDKATLISRRAGGDAPVDFLKIVMKKVLISSMQFGASGGSESVPLSLSLNFGEVEYIYTPQNADGSAGAAVTQGWDIAGGKEAA